MSRVWATGKGRHRVGLRAGRGRHAVLGWLPLCAGCAAQEADRTVLVQQVQPASTSVPSRPSGGRHSEPSTDPGSGAVLADAGVPLGSTVDTASDAGASPDTGVPCVSTPKLDLSSGAGWLRARWSAVTLEAGPADCRALSATLEQALVYWDPATSALQFAGGASPFLLAPGQGDAPLPAGSADRMRRCSRTVDDGHGGQAQEAWRFHEQLRFDETPHAGCGEPTLTAHYVYRECSFGESNPRLPSDVCAADEPSACTFSAVLELSAAEPPTGAAPAPTEATCRDLVGATVVARPIAAGEPCTRSDACVAGHFCSRERADELGCVADGDGRCQPAPAYASCPQLTEPVCECEGTEPLEPDDYYNPYPNACTERALGRSTQRCPVR